MGNSGGKAKISKEDMQFLQEKTQLDKDSIQVLDKQTENICHLNCKVISI